MMFALFIYFNLKTFAEIQAFFAEVRRWCAEAGEDVTVEYVEQTLSKAITPVDDTDPWWTCYKTVLDEKCVYNY